MPTPPSHALPACRSRCTAGRATTWAVRKRRRGTRRRPGRHRQLSRQGPHAGRTACRSRQGLSLIPGKHRLNLHACYAETGGKRVERDELSPGPFSPAGSTGPGAGLGLDFNPTYFAHPKSADGFTLPHRDEGVRRFWIEHGIACRKIGAAMGGRWARPCITNFWIPDGYKDTPVTAVAPRTAGRIARCHLRRADRPALNLRCGREQAVRHRLRELRGRLARVLPGLRHHPQEMLCLDAGHFHPTETIADKISAVLLCAGRILLHVSRGVRWDSDHVVISTDDLQAIAQEFVRGDYLGRVHIGLDFFDASINRVAAWVIGARAMLRALLIALLETAAPARRNWSRRFHHPAGPAGGSEIISKLRCMWDYYCLTPRACRWARHGWVKSNSTKKQRIVQTAMAAIGTNPINEP